MLRLVGFFLDFFYCVLSLFWQPVEYILSQYLFVWKMQFSSFKTDSAKQRSACAKSLAKKTSEHIFFCSNFLQMHLSLAKAHAFRLALNQFLIIVIISRVQSVRWPGTSEQPFFHAFFILLAANPYFSLNYVLWISNWSFCSFATSRVQAITSVSFSRLFGQALRTYLFWRLN